MEQGAAQHRIGLSSQAGSSPSMEALTSAMGSLNAINAVRSKSGKSSGGGGPPLKRSELVQEIAVMLQKMHKQSELTLEALRNLYGLSHFQQEELAEHGQVHRTEQPQSEDSVRSSITEPPNYMSKRLHSAVNELQPEQTPEYLSRAAPAATSSLTSPMPSSQAPCGDGLVSLTGDSDASSVLQGLHVDIDRMLRTAEALRSFNSDTKQLYKDLQTITLMPELTPEAAASIQEHISEPGCPLADVGTAERSPGVQSQEPSTPVSDQHTTESLASRTFAGSPNGPTGSKLSNMTSGAYRGEAPDAGICKASSGSGAQKPHWSEQLAHLREEAKAMRRDIDKSTESIDSISAKRHEKAAAAAAALTAQPPPSVVQPVPVHTPVAGSGGSTTIRRYARSSSAVLTQELGVVSAASVATVCPPSPSRVPGNTTLRTSVSPGRAARSMTSPTRAGSFHAAVPIAGVVAGDGRDSDFRAGGSHRTPGRPLSPSASNLSPCMRYRASSPTQQVMAPQTMAAASVAPTSTRSTASTTPLQCVPPSGAGSCRTRVGSPGPPRVSSPGPARRPHQAATSIVGAAGSALRPAAPAPTGLFEVGAHTMAGEKMQCKDWVNQDTYLVVPVSHDCLFVAVFDGHGINGQHSANLAKTMFAEQAAALGRAGSGLESMFRTLFRNVQAALETQGLARMSGTTATAAVIDATAGTVSTAYTGDSRLLATLGPRVYFETKDHVFDAAAESRCIEHGGEVREQTVAGVCARRIFKRGESGPGLTMSRSLGDAECHDLGVLSEPTVHCCAPFWPGCTLVVASDGVWEKISSERAASEIPSLDPQAASVALVDKAYSEWHGDVDDITAVVVRLSSPATNLNAPSSSPGPSRVSSVATLPLASRTTKASAGSSVVRRRSPGRTSVVRCNSPSRTNIAAPFSSLSTTKPNGPTRYSSPSARCHSPSRYASPSPAPAKQEASPCWSASANAVAAGSISLSGQQRTMPIQHGRLRSST